jgi:hypothetical protein
MSKVRTSGSLTDFGRLNGVVEVRYSWHTSLVGFPRLENYSFALLRRAQRSNRLLALPVALVRPLVAPVPQPMARGKDSRLFASTAGTQRSCGLRHQIVPRGRWTYGQTGIRYTEHLRLPAPDQHLPFSTGPDRLAARHRSRSSPTDRAARVGKAGFLAYGFAYVSRWTRTRRKRIFAVMRRPR